MTTASAPLPEAPARTGTPILEAKGLSRSFGHVRGSERADFDIYPGEVVAVIGDNGAGKSTLVKALTGNLALDTGRSGSKASRSTSRRRSRPPHWAWRSSTRTWRWRRT